MSYLIEGAVKTEDAGNSFIEIGAETSPILLYVTDAPTEENYLLV